MLACFIHHSKLHNFKLLARRYKLKLLIPSCLTSFVSTNGSHLTSMKRQFFPTCPGAAIVLFSGSSGRGKEENIDRRRMGAPSAHGQRNKGHKPGRRAARGAREKHKEAKEEIFGEHRKSIKVSAARSLPKQTHPGDLARYSYL